MAKSIIIHPTAIVDPAAILGNNVKIGPYCIIGPKVNLGDRVELKSHVVIEGRTTIGDGTIIYPFASIGHPPQDLKYKGESSEVIIGKNNIIREYVTINPGTEGGSMLTSIGDGGLFMVGVHIAHDCHIGNGVIFANYVSLAGHVTVGDFSRIGGLSAVLQYVRLGPYSMIGGLSGVAKDLIPYGLASSERANLEGLNLVGMKRAGLDKQQTLDALQAVDELFKEEGIFADKIQKTLDKYTDNSIVEQIVEFIQQDGSRSFCMPKKNR